MKLKPNARSPLSQTVRATDPDSAGSQGESVHFRRSADFRPMFEVDLDRVHPRADQPRRHFDETELQELAASIAARGVLQPILVRRLPAREGEYEIVAGERRWRASRLAGKDRIRAVTVDGDPAEIALIENLQRVDLAPIEEARAIQALMDSQGYSQGQVADLLGKSRVRINETLRLLALPEDMQNSLAADKTLPRTTLLQIARTDDPATRNRLWQQAKAGAGEKEIRAARPAAGRQSATDTVGRFFADLIRLTRSLPAVPLNRDGLASDQQAALRELRDRLNSLLGE